MESLCVSFRRVVPFVEHLQTGVKFEQFNINIFCLTNIRLPLKHTSAVAVVTWKSYINNFLTEFKIMKRKIDACSMFMIFFKRCTK